MTMTSMIAGTQGTTSLIPGTLHVYPDYHTLEKSYWLDCQLGHLKVEHMALNALDTASYPGFFEIKSLTPHFVNQDDQIVVEMIANLGRMAIDLEVHPLLRQFKKQSRKGKNTMKAKSNESASLTVKSAESEKTIVHKPLLTVVRQQVDLMDTYESKVAEMEAIEEKEIIAYVEDVLKALNMTESDKELLHVTEEASLTPEKDTDAELFGELWPLSQEVKLDPSHSRSFIRTQIARLEQLGYTFQSTTQSWKCLVAV